MLDLEFVQRTDRGRVRQNNEDYIDCVAPRNTDEVQSHGWLFALADGVGGQDCGEVASRVAVESIIAGFRSASAPTPHTALLSRLVQSANTDVYETGRAAGAAVATTIVACAVRHASAVIAHVGDSRCYLIRRSEVRQLTQDHTLVNQQVRIGILNAEEAATSATRHVLSRSLGNEMFVSVDTTLVELQPDDMLLQCSDGLHGSLRPHHIAKILSDSANLNAAADRLVAEANERDGGDNISLQLARIHSVERMGMYRGRPYKIQ